MKKPLRLFITGTDTNIGKTHVGVELLRAFNQAGLSTLGIKPVASGCQWIDGTLYNSDALALQLNSSVKLNYQDINPYAFEPAIAPHIAAQYVNCNLTLEQLNQKTHLALNTPADVCLIEGAGGWYTPLNQKETLADFVISNQLSAVMVVGIRLGCINHALLTFKAMQQDGVNIVGWIANLIDPNAPHPDGTVQTLKDKLPIPHLDTVAHTRIAGRKPLHAAALKLQQ